jgi:hypothetical protein
VAVALLRRRRCLGQWVRRPAVMGFPISVRQREGVEVALFQAKADDAASMDVALLLGASWSSTTCSALGPLSWVKA